MADGTAQPGPDTRYRVIIQQLAPPDHPTQPPKVLMDHEVRGPMNLVAVLATLADDIILTEE